MASAGWRNVVGLAVEVQLTAARALRTGQDVEELVLALTFEGDDAQHFARIELERNIVELRPERQAASDDSGT